MFFVVTRVLIRTGNMLSNTAATVVVSVYVRVHVENISLLVTSHTVDLSDSLGSH